MMKKIGLLLFLFSSISLAAQDDVSIVVIIDDLTVRWDETALKMRTYQDIHNFCEEEDYRTKTIALLDNIHHWDTTLYFIVRGKYAENEDDEAEATLRDIERLETEYTTENFKSFIQQECTMLKVIESHFDQETVKSYEKEIKKFEKELNKYVTTITSRIDIIDEHIHHLDLDD